MPTPRVSRSAGATPSGGAGAGRGETRSPLARRVSPRDRRADKARSPAHARSPLAEIFGSPEAGAARRGSSLGGAGEDKAPRTSVPSLDEDEADEAEAIMATQVAPASEAVGGDEPRVGGDVFVGRPSGAPEETTPSATPTTTPGAGASAEPATEAATRRLSERVFRDTGKRLGPSWTARYDEKDSPSGKRRRLWFVSPGGKKFDGPGKVSAFVGTVRATEGSDYLLAARDATDANDANDANDGRNVSDADEKDDDDRATDGGAAAPVGEDARGGAPEPPPPPSPPDAAPRSPQHASESPRRSRECETRSAKETTSRREVTAKRAEEATPTEATRVGEIGETRRASSVGASPPRDEDARAAEAAGVATEATEATRVVAPSPPSEPSPARAPPRRWSDRRAGDAAARVIRARLLSSTSTRRDALARRPTLHEHRRHHALPAFRLG